ncbi:MAG: hypothetical protein M3P98_02415 [bacterium]|nr:hypothetical protein [bacterium]
MIQDFQPQTTSHPKKNVSSNNANPTSYGSGPFRKKKKSKKNLIYVVLILLLFAGSLGGTYFFYTKYQEVKENPDIVVKQQVDAIVQKVSKLINLPQDETPSLATIEDIGQLKDQHFFDNAENGDQVLIYTKAAQAIIYRERENRLINVGPVAINGNAQVGIALLNAGGNNDDVESKLTKKFAESISIISREDAKDASSVGKTTVVDLNGNNAQLAKQIADEIGGEVGQLPSSETKPANSSILIIVK